MPSSKQAFYALMTEGRWKSRPTVVFEALEELTCKRCKRIIVPGENFTRRHWSNQLWPYCCDCIPFSEPISKEEYECTRKEWYGGK
jgi:RNase P subunit RPR2